MHEYCEVYKGPPSLWWRIPLTAIISIAIIAVIAIGTWLSLYHVTVLAYMGIGAFVLVVLGLIWYAAWDIAGALLR